MPQVFFESVNQVFDKTYEFTSDPSREEYLQIEAEMLSDFMSYVKDGVVISNLDLSRPPRRGKIVDWTAETFDTISLKLMGDDGKTFSANLRKGRTLVQFEDRSARGLYTLFYDAHESLTADLKAMEDAKRELDAAIAKEKAAALRAEQAFTRRKERAERKWADMVKHNGVGQNDEDGAVDFSNAAIEHAEGFYYALGWLATHTARISASMVDYLEPSFYATFGSNYKPTIVHSKLRTSGGKPMKYGFSFTIDLIPNCNTSTAPALLQDRITSNKIHDTSLIWQLVSSYGFSFGKNFADVTIRKISAELPTWAIQDFIDGCDAD